MIIIVLDHSGFECMMLIQVQDVTLSWMVTALLSLVLKQELCLKFLFELSYNTSRNLFSRGHLLDGRMLLLPHCRFNKPD